jgi:hypothetical protein
MSTLLPNPKVKSAARIKSMISTGKIITIIMDSPFARKNVFHGPIHNAIHPDFQVGEILYVTTGKELFKLGKIVSRSWPIFDIEKDENIAQSEMEKFQRKITVTTHSQ